jgi:hypothetical protein
MPELFFKYKTTPYLFDTNKMKLFRLKDRQQIEVNNPDILRKVRLGSIEINRERAFRLAFEYEK